MTQNLDAGLPASVPNRKEKRAIVRRFAAKSKGLPPTGPADLEWQHLITWGLLKSPWRWTVSPRQPQVVPEDDSED